MIKLLKCRIIGGKHNGNEVPVYGDGALLGYLTNGTIVLTASPGEIDAAELRAYVDNGYTRVWTEGGKNPFPKEPENWIEITHFQYIVEPPELKQIVYKVVGVSFRDGFTVTVEEVK